MIIEYILKATVHILLSTYFTATWSIYLVFKFLFRTHVKHKKMINKIKEVVSVYGSCIQNAETRYFYQLTFPLKTKDCKRNRDFLI